MPLSVMARDISKTIDAIMPGQYTTPCRVLGIMRGLVPMPDRARMP